MVFVFQTVLIASLAGTVLAAILAALRPLTGRRFSAGWHYYMWLAVLLVMVLPVRISLPESALPPRESVSAPVTPPSHEMEWIESETTPTPNTTPVAPQPAVKSPVVTFWQENGWELLAFVWAGGALVLFGTKVAQYAIQRRRLMRHTRAVECPALAEYTRRRVRVRTGDEIGSPFLLGLFRPTLFLPDIALTEEQTANILSHEMTHLRRGDLWYKWFAMAVKCAHWFNPAVYLINRQLQAECEVSCDLAAVKRMDSDSAAHYLQTILFLLSANKRRPLSLATEMSGNKQLLKRRFLMVKEKKRTSKRAAWISALMAIMLVVTVVLAGGVLAGCTTEAPAAEASGQPTDTGTTTKPDTPITPAPLSIEDYSITLAGVKVKLHDEAAPLLAALGTPDDVRDMPYEIYLQVTGRRCYTYSYGWIETVIHNDREEIYAINLHETCNAVTPRNITIGNTKEELFAAYGDSDIGDWDRRSYDSSFDGVWYFLEFGYSKKGPEDTYYRESDNVEWIILQSGRYSKAYN